MSSPGDTNTYPIGLGVTECLLVSLTLHVSIKAYELIGDPVFPRIWHGDYSNRAYDRLADPVPIPTIDGRWDADNEVPTNFELLEELNLAWGFMIL